MTFTPVAEFGREHWALFNRVASQVLSTPSHIATLERERMRCNDSTHSRFLPLGYRPWHGSFGTSTKRETLPQHDDWDCLDDLEVEGLVEIENSTLATVSLTSQGREVFKKLNEYRSRGGSMAAFDA